MLNPRSVKCIKIENSKSKNSKLMQMKEIKQITQRRGEKRREECLA
jgi:hypothetical protein